MGTHQKSERYMSPAVGLVLREQTAEQEVVQPLVAVVVAPEIREIYLCREQVL
jgi:hypothetical protein